MSLTNGTSESRLRLVVICAYVVYSERVERGRVRRRPFVAAVEAVVVGCASVPNPASFIATA